MKQCPVCHEQFDDRELFCDQDGANLLDQTDSLREVLNHAQPKPASSAWITGAIGGFIGIIICVLLYLLFLAPNPRDVDNQDRRSSQTQQTAPVRSTLVAAPAPQVTPPLETESPSPEEEAAASPSPTAAPQPATAAALNNGPIATGTKEARNSERAIIKMRDGSSVEADAAWEDAQGVWYRRSGLVSFVEKSRVEAITDPPQRQPAKAEVKAP
jgi:hypothetical protein